MSSAPSRRAPRRSSEPPERGGAPLRLSLSGGKLGLEIYEDLPLEPFVVEDLGWTLPTASFPLDLSGGVDMFRHRRGVLARLVLRASYRSLVQHLGQRLHDALGRALAPPRLWPLEAGVGVGLVGEQGALAFDLIWAPGADGARWIVGNARATGDIGVPLAPALRVAETLFAGLAERRGRVLLVPELARRVSRQLAPLLGARAPDAAGVGIDRLDIDADGLRLWLTREAPVPALSAEAARHLELARLCADGDEALARGEPDRARQCYIASLERAPRQPELSALVAHIDLTHAARGEAALGMLVDCMPAFEFGLLGARLLARAGDAAGARHAVLVAAAREPHAPVAAGLWLELAELARSLPERLEALDRAVAAAPALASARWARFEARLQNGDDAGALGDAESLEAAARGPHARHEVLSRAGRRLLELGQVRASGQLFERALRYVPGDPEATCGLGRALVASGRGERAMALFERSLELAEAAGTTCPEALIELARLLVARCGDHPQAIARVSQVPESSPRRLEALALEGRWRAALGDLRGASLAYAKLREACEREARGAASDGRGPEVAAWLTDAAELERHSLGDLASAERHLAAALRIAPRNVRVRRLYRQAAAALAKTPR